MLNWYYIRITTVMEGLLINHLLGQSPGQQIHYQLLRLHSKSCNKCKLIKEAPENLEGTEDPKVPSE